MKLVNNSYYSQFREIQTAALGTTLGAGMLAAAQCLSTYTAFYSLPSLVRNFVIFGCCAGTVAGVVMSVYSMFRLCQRFISHDNQLNKAVTATALGVLLTTTSYSIGEHLLQIVPNYLVRDFAFYACGITGIGSIIFTSYAAYRLGKAIINSLNQLPVPGDDEVAKASSAL